MKKIKIKTYSRNEIQEVYRRHVYYSGSVVYSENGGYSWQSVPMDSGKWKHEWIFAFIKINGE